MCACVQVLGKLGAIMGLAGRCLIHLYAGLLADLQDAHLPLSKAPTAEAEGSDEILAGCDFITHPFVQPLPTFLVSTGGHQRSLI